MCNLPLIDRGDIPTKRDFHSHPWECLRYSAVRDLGVSNLERRNPRSPHPLSLFANAPVRAGSGRYGFAGQYALRNLAIFVPGVTKRHL
jgi:hypothetical protein